MKPTSPGARPAGAHRPAPAGEHAMHIADICTRRVIGITAASSVADAARTMAQHQVGALIVVESRDERDVPVGVLTDRDIVLSVVAEGRDPARLNVAQVMSCGAVTCRDDADLVDVARMMRSRGARRLPVLDAGGHIVGVVSAHDVVCALQKELSELCATWVDEPYVAHGDDDSGD
jgi:CBS domain-containing protein